MANSGPVSVIGLGSMGYGMAKSALRAGLTVHGFDVVPDQVRRFREEGGAKGDLAQVAGELDAVVVVVLNAAQTEAVLFGDDAVVPRLKRGAAVLACATVPPAFARDMAARCAEAGVLYLDAPISGGSVKAAEGRLSIMASGSPDAFAAARPVLDAMAETVFELGDEPGAGSAMKAVNQMLVGTHIAAMAEALTFGMTQGVEPAKFVEVISKCAGTSWALENRAPHIVDGDYTPLSAVDIWLKDLGIVLEIARGAKFGAPLTAAALQQFLAASGSGLGREDDAAVAKVYARNAGLRLPGGRLMLLGCIGDDFTGSSDLANTLAKGGMRVVQYTGVPGAPADAAVEAGVVALKSRSIAPQDAVRQSLAALEWLRKQGCRQYFFKYCSTFDSTPDGNIGPVAEALAEALDAWKVIVCPAFPGTGRSIYQGHLFVNDRLLSESGMQNHPLTPMTDPDIRRWLAPQTALAVGHVGAAAVLGGARAIGEALDKEHEAGKRLIVVDAMRDADLVEIGKAGADLPLITGGSGVALGLPANFAARGAIAGGGADWRGQAGKCVALSGSCSTATRGQVALHAQSNPAVEIRAAEVIEGRLTAEQVAAQLIAAEGVPLAFSSADPAVVADVQKTFGREKSAEALEGFFAELARQLVAKGVTRMITAGGETSGAVVEGLRLEALEIGPEIDPGVPAVRAGDDLVLALKSGNFGAPDFFAKAAGVLGGGA